MTQKRRTRHEAGPTDVLGRGRYIKGFDEDYSTAVIPFPARRLTPCTGCGAPFLSARAWHKVCRQCWCWHKALTGVMTTRAALREVQ
jgi:hypothetical protein